MPSMGKHSRREETNKKTTMGRSYVLARGVARQTRQQRRIRRWEEDGRPEIDAVIRHSHTTVSSWIVDSFYKRRKQIKDKLAIAKSRINLSLDGWTASTTGDDLRFEYFEDKWQKQPDWIRRIKRSFRELFDEYYDECYGDVDTESDDQQEEPKSAYHEYNQISSEFLSRKRKRIAKDKDKDSLEYDRYIKSVDEKLKVKDPLVWWNQHKSDYPLLARMAFDLFSISAISAEVERIFSSTGNLVTDDRNQLGEEVLEATECQKHWIAGNLGGDFDALKRAFLLREPIEEFIAAEIRAVSAEARKCGKNRYQDENDIERDELSIKDWDELRSIMDILEPFKKWPLKLQGKCRNGALHDILPAMDGLLAHLEDAKLQYNDTSIHIEHLRTFINIALVDLTPVYYAAIALHPEMKFEYFEEEWGDRPDWIRTAKEVTIALWESEYKCQTSSSDDVLIWKDSKEEPEWKRKKQARLAKDTQDSLQRYLEKEEGDQIDNPLQYWITKLQDSSSRHKFIASMRVAIHNIPGMSTEVERVFSSTKILISERRNRLSDDIIEASECLKAWQKEQLTLSYDQDIRKMDEMLDDLEERAGSL
ncbi:uncharacterized protein Z518_03584 [Rhinocladiella mackenziei CBS 650.93]|uniref:HAT C-terminal dimerisation domain-containing protein n=1 Tax=Rhinocladiella mackenziei CBS 650.93 TaxID=1442369 RepID=A0A0D2FU29_9EURO|nr:uncharacterized protein Z518_03584 [Rhinocladiella mackenziei CBS 650.93]KIX05612.1 hypothetical protein Z518_03584 [Rhinocladiella mackenziei CBS 650.93]